MSDSLEPILTLQDIGWLTRKAICTYPMTVKIKHVSEGDPPVDKLDIDMKLTGGIIGTDEVLELSWIVYPDVDDVFGPINSQSRRVTVDMLTKEERDDFLKADWTDESKTDGLIEYLVASDSLRSGKKWVADQTWGFEEINGEKRYSRHVHFVGSKGEVQRAKLVYDYSECICNAMECQ